MIELLGLSSDELIALCVRLGHPAYRGRQLTEWVYRKGAREFAAMSSLPGALRAELARAATLTRSEVVTESRSPDGTRKSLLRLSDGETIESVLLPYPDRTSVCVSTQVGCPAGCLFCATADCGFVRSLTAGEIVDQVLTLQETGGRRVTHVVFMGMGEPLLNFDHVVKAVHLLNEEVGIAMRRLTVSTVGITPAIDRLRELKLQLTLAVSLHAPDDALRAELIPVAGKHPLPELIAACRDYAEFTKRRVTFEYLLLAGVNDSPDQAVRLASLLKATLANVNLIPYNEAPGKPFKRPTPAAVRGFRAALESAGVEVTQRVERGHSIAAACGQLKQGGVPSPSPQPSPPGTRE